MTVTFWRCRCNTCRLPWTKYGDREDCCPFCGSLDIVVSVGG